MVFVLLSIFVTGCGTSVSYGLFFEESQIVTEIDGKIEAAERITFEKGEKVGLALLDVGKFKQGEDGLHLTVSPKEKQTFSVFSISVRVYEKF